VVVVALVPSRVATVVRCIIARLLPVINSTFITFHTPLVSGVHAKVHCPPSLKTSPGPGAEGTGSAETKVDRRSAENARMLNIANDFYRCCNIMRVLLFFFAFY